jgi:hypothetical protein
MGTLVGLGALPGALIGSAAGDCRRTAAAVAGAGQLA